MDGVRYDLRPPPDREVERATGTVNCECAPRGKAAMPYVNCPRCGLRTYTAGGRMWPEACPSCGTRLRTSAGRYEMRRHPPAVARLLDPEPHAPEAARRALDQLVATIGDDALDRLQLLVT